MSQSPTSLILDSFELSMKGYYYNDEKSLIVEVIRVDEWIFIVGHEVLGVLWCLFSGGKEDVKDEPACIF